ncbi:acyl-CoA dehydrogenase/oxidase C-terminal [Lipomyces kononenkoae]|uniref:Acyl-CoA dehydrogenase/oxidase C-terminal n=1 Tax=Lipomyces kononenkoae TaxID=34357 RepID=A0ACC3SSV9_LIPKO
MLPTTEKLLQLDLFRGKVDSLSMHDRISLAYHRARVIARTYGFTVKDVLELTPKFWQYHQDLINPLDMAAFTLITIQYNLCAGTLAPFISDRVDLEELMEQILNFDVSAQFLLTEVGHGLDARNLETTATLLPNGGFELHTPHRNAAKYMPPTSPQVGFPRVAIVIARLLVDSKDRGTRPFIVWLNDGYRMRQGVHIRVLPRRAGSKPLDHCITMFDHIRLPRTALLGVLPGQYDPSSDFHLTISRVHVGTLALSTTLIPILKRAVFVAGKYSFRRHVLGSGKDRKPIITFRTQQRPILHTLSQIAVYECYAQWSIRGFIDTGLDYRVRHGIATAFKAVVTQAAQASLFALAERCGAQGLFEYNNIIESQLEARGISIAEGDTLALCIRLASELLIGRYTMPAPKDISCMLAKYEDGIYRVCTKILKSLHEGHRSDEYNTQILPHCQVLVEAIGHRMAYESARDTGIDKDLLALYEAGVLLHAPAWYVKSACLDIKSQFVCEAKAMNSILPRLDQLLDETGAGPYCTAPIITDEDWHSFVDGLQGYGTEQEDTVPDIHEYILNRSFRSRL